METVSKNIIFGLKMTVKSGLEKVILKSIHAGKLLVHKRENDCPKSSVGPKAQFSPSAVAEAVGLKKNVKNMP
jgi:hypothetical protein